MGQPILAAVAFQAAADELPNLTIGILKTHHRSSPLSACFSYEKFPCLEAQSSRMAHYERRLPHWDFVGRPVFVTFRLHGSLPASRAFPPERLRSGKAFAAMDRILGRGSTGPLYLNQPGIAELVMAALRYGDTELHRYQLHSFVVMPSHVHMLVTPNVVATRWLGPLKGITAYQANRILGRAGRAFWQDESYDHVVRNDGEWQRIRAYIEGDPVRTGLVMEAGDFPWSSAGTPRAAA